MQIMTWELLTKTKFFGVNAGMDELVSALQVRLLKWNARGGTLACICCSDLVDSSDVSSAVRGDYAAS